MSTFKQSALSPVRRPLAVAGLALLGLSLAACSPGPRPSDSPATESSTLGATTTTPEQSTDSPEPEAEAAESPDAPAPIITTLSVTGAKDSALIKTVIVTGDGKETGGKMTTQTLPFTLEQELPEGSAFTKLLVIAKYPDASKAEIACSIAVDGVVMDSNNSSTSKPAECLVISE